MNITKSQFKRIIKEEIEEALSLDNKRAKDPVKKWLKQKSLYDISRSSPDYIAARKVKDPEIHIKAAIADKAYIIINKIKQLIGDFPNLDYAAISAIIHKNSTYKGFLELGRMRLLGDTKELYTDAENDIEESMKHVSDIANNLNEKKDKKMTKKYSSFKQQQTITENFRRFINEIRVEDQVGTSTNRLTITNKEYILAAIKEFYPDGISQHAEVIVDFTDLDDEATDLDDEAIWQKLEKVGLVAHLSREIPNVTDPSIIQSEVEVWLDNRHYDAL